MNSPVGFSIKIIRGPGKDQIIPLDTRETIIGRARNPGDRAKGKILLHDETVSRLHAILRYHPDTKTFALIHKSETNLTYVNGEPIEEATLRPGDEILVGNTTLQLQQRDTRFTPTPTKPVVSSNPILQARAKLDSIKLFEPSPSTSSTSSSMLYTLQQIAPSSGEVITLEGNNICFPPATPQSTAQIHWDAQLSLGTHSLPPESVALRWNRHDKTYHLHVLKDIKLRLERPEGDVTWSADVQPGASVSLRAQDIILIGPLRIAVGRQRKPFTTTTRSIPLE